MYGLLLRVLVSTPFSVISPFVFGGESVLQDNSCEEKLHLATQEQSEATKAEMNRVFLEAPFSYIATGAAYTLGAFIYPLESIGTFAATCPAHMTALLLFSNLRTGYFEGCSQYRGPPLRFGRAVYKNTKDMREVDFTEVAMMHRDAAECFKASSNSPSLERAKDILAPLVHDGAFLSHVRDDERTKLVSLWESLK